MHQNDSVPKALDSENAVCNISHSNNDVNVNKHERIEQRDSESEKDEKREEEHQFTVGNLDNEESKNETDDIQNGTVHEMDATETNAQSFLIKSNNS